MSNISYQPAPKILDIQDFIADPVQAATFPQGTLRFRNQRWAQAIGLGDLSAEDFRRHFWGFAPLAQNLKTPLALRYHGHQFLHYNPDLGDGRGFLFAQLRDEHQRLLDLGTKGSGQTPYSRDGDGRLTLQGGMREVLAASLLEARGVNTSKAFSLFETGEALERHDEPSPTRSAVLVRLSHSHLRIGSFERLRFMEQKEPMARLLRHVVTHYYAPDLDPDQDPAKLAPAFLKALARRCAAMVAQWTLAGFVHGVLNTDNINVTGESFDYGPFRVLEHFDVHKVAAYFDHHGLYAFGRQSTMVAHNLGQLATSLLSLASIDDLQAALDHYPVYFGQALAHTTLARTGRQSAGKTQDAQLAQALLGFLQAQPVSIEGLLFDLFATEIQDPRIQSSPRAQFYQGEEFTELCRALGAHACVKLDSSQQTLLETLNPVELDHPRVEAIWAAIAKDNDWGPFCATLARIDQTRRLYKLTRAPTADT